MFASLADIETNFRSFYDLLNLRAVEDLKYRGEFQRVEGLPIRDLRFCKPARQTHSKKPIPRDEFAADFDLIMSTFFERLKGDQDADMIQKCFVVTAESQAADDKLLRIAEGLVEKMKFLV